MKPLSGRLRSWLGGLRRSRAQEARDLGVEESVENIDRNATASAASKQSAKDDAAEEQGAPAEQGGEG